MTKTTRKALSLLLSIVMVFSLTMVFAMTLNAYAAINLDAAKQIALDDAGLSMSEVVFTEAKLDGREFDIDFRSGRAEYDYEISNEGKILSLAYDSNNRVAGSKTLNADAAKEAALKFIGADAADAQRLRCEYDDGEYEVSFVYGDREYDLNVSAVDGSIIEYDYETVQSSSNIIAIVSGFFQRIIDFFTRFLA